MDDKDIISQLGLPDSLNKKLEELLKVDKVKEKSGQRTFNKSFAELSKARKKFRKAYKRIREHVPSKDKDNDKDLFDTEDEDDGGSHLSSGSDFSDISNASDKDPEQIIDKLPTKFMTDEQRQKFKDQEETTKFLEAEYEEKKEELEMAIEALGADQGEESQILKAMARELSKDGDYNFAACNEELDRVIAEIKSQSRAFRSSKPSQAAKIDKFTELM